eukprot:GHVS01070443.1.p1 GENE.GHVS01070443.1~~GHVS01070443.1.p1  ORF type:complete len:546 (-),score=122.42 GHVS01070443.1:266-1903(-)
MAFRSFLSLLALVGLCVALLVTFFYSSGTHSSTPSVVSLPNVFENIQDIQRLASLQRDHRLPPGDPVSAYDLRGMISPPDISPSSSSSSNLALPLFRLLCYVVSIADGDTLRCRQQHLYPTSSSSSSPQEAANGGGLVVPLAPPPPLTPHKRCKEKQQTPLLQPPSGSFPSREEDDDVVQLDPCRPSCLAGWYGALGKTTLVVRLYRVDAPELDRKLRWPPSSSAPPPAPHGNGQPFALEAREAVVDMVLGRHVCLEVYGVDFHKRLLATVHFVSRRGPAEQQQSAAETGASHHHHRQAAGEQAKADAFRTLQRFCESEDLNPMTPTAAASSFSTPPHSPPMFSAPVEKTLREKLVIGSAVDDVGQELLTRGLAVLYEKKDSLETHFKKHVKAFVSRVEAAGGGATLLAAPFPYPHESAVIQEPAIISIASFSIPDVVLGSPATTYRQLKSCLIRPLPSDPSPLKSLCCDSCFYRNPFLLSVNTSPKYLWESTFCLTIRWYIRTCAYHCLAFFPPKVAKMSRTGLWSLAGGAGISPSFHRRRKNH